MNMIKSLSLVFSAVAFGDNVTKIKLKTSLSVVLIILFFSCENGEITDHIKNIEPTTQSTELALIQYAEYKPETTDQFELDGFEINHAYKLDSLFVLSAYADGDLELSDNPTNWGDRLIVYSNYKIIFQSKPVGDVYLYEPHFFRNEQNGSVIIICQLGYEYYFGGEAFLIDKGGIKYIGEIEIESPDWELSLVDIVVITEVDDEIRFNFNSDSIIFKPGNEDLLIKNEHIHYTYKENVFDLKGM